MSRRRTVVLVLLILATGLAAFTWGVLRTEAGARWTLARLATALPGQLEVESVHGNVLGTLKLVGIRYEDGDRRIDIGRVELEWHPRSLLRRELRIERVFAEPIRVVIKSAPQEGPIELHDMVLRGELQLRKVELRGIRIDRLGGEAPAVVEQLALRGRARGSEVHLESILVKTPTLRLEASGRLDTVGDYPVTIETSWSSLVGEGEPLQGEGRLEGDLWRRLSLDQELRGLVVANLQASLEQPLRDPHLQIVLEASVGDLRSFHPRLESSAVKLSMHAEGPAAGLRGGGALGFDHPAYGRWHARFEGGMEGDELELEELEITSEEAESVLRARGRILLSEGPAFALNGEWRKISWPLGEPSRLASDKGSFEISGRTENYELEIEGQLAARDYPEGDLRLSATGGASWLELESLEGHVLGGNVLASGRFETGDETVWEAAIDAHRLDPAALYPHWPGQLSLRATTSGSLSPTGQPKGELRVQEIRGRLRGRSVSGRGSLLLVDERIDIPSFVARWGEDRLEVRGHLGERSDLRWRGEIADLAELAPDARGSLALEGRLDGPRKAWRLDTSGRGSRLEWGSLGADNLEFDGELDLSPGGNATIDLGAEAVRLPGVVADHLQISVRGGVDDHRAEGEISTRGVRLALELEGGLDPSRDGWEGSLKRVSLGSEALGEWQLEGPSRVRYGPEETRWESICLASGPSRLCGHGEIANDEFELAATLAEVPVALLQPLFLEGLELRGELDGELELSGNRLGPWIGIGEFHLGSGHVVFVDQEKIVVEARLGEARADLIADGETTRLELEVGWPEVRGLALGHIEIEGSIAGGAERALPIRGSLLTRIDDPGALVARFSRLAASSRGSLAVETEIAGFLERPELRARGRIDGLGLELLQPLLADNARLEGMIDGLMEAEFPYGRPASAELTLGARPGVALYDSDGESIVVMASGDGVFALDEAGLRGSVQVELEDGEGRGRLDLSLPSFRPADGASPEQVLIADGHVDLDRLAWVAFLAPDLTGLQGQLRSTFELRGTLDHPRLRADAEISHGRFESPASGLVLEDLSVRTTAVPDAPLELSARSRVGPGHLEATGKLPLQPSNEDPARFTVRGERALIWDTPGIRILASPDLRLAFTGRAFDLEGEVEVPEAAVDMDRHIGNSILPSTDVELIGASRPPHDQPLEVSGRVRVKLGDEVSLRSQGLATRLEGAVTWTGEPERSARAVGNLELRDGIYRAYGQSLVIENGRLIYAGGPIENPGLSLRASRRARDGTRAGIQASGSIRDPVVTLWSEPQLPEAEALSYLLLGRSLSGASASDGELLTSAATTLGIKGGNFLAKRLATRFGIDEVTIKSEGSLEETALFFGKYLSPRLYVTYGIGFFTSASTFRLRFLMTPRWTLQAETGGESGGDILYVGEAEPEASIRPRAPTD